jgi:hypothetical protein
MKPDVRVCADVNELSRRAAEAAVRTINDAARGTGRCSLVLSGREHSAYALRPSCVGISRSDPVGTGARVLGG